MLKRGGLDFLKQLALNNNREWFNDHKQDYEDQVRTPALNYITAMSDVLPQISDKFTAIAKKTGGSMMRPYRDVRFSKDKTPYKTNLGIQFRHQLGKNAHAPGMYLHITPAECFIGIGIWRPDSASLRRIRHFMVDNPNYWLSSKKTIQNSADFHIGGDRLVRPPQGFDKEHPLIEDLKYKDFIVIADVPVKSIVSDDFIESSLSYFLQGKDYLEWLCDALEVPF